MNIQASVTTPSLQLAAKPAKMNSNSKTEEAAAQTKSKDTFTASSPSQSSLKTPLLEKAKIFAATGAAVAVPTIAGAALSQSLGTAGALIASTTVGPIAGAIIGGGIGVLTGISTVGKEHKIAAAIWGTLAGVAGAAAGAVAIPALAALGAGTGYIGAVAASMAAGAGIVTYISVSEANKAKKEAQQHSQPAPY